MDHKRFLKSLSPLDKARLTERSDKAGLLHLALHLGLIVALGTLIALKVPFWGVLMLPQGVLIVFLFTLQHEATHKTPFASERLNEAVGHLIAVLILQPFIWFRYFHLAHHRYTQDPENDPELAGQPKPDSWPDLLWHLTGIDYWRAKTLLLSQHAFGTPDAKYLPERTHARLRREARGALAAYAAAIVFSFTVSPVLLHAWFVPVTIGFPVLRLYLLAEHGRCPQVANMFDNTRTTYTNAVVRFLAWNMPYHAEHHAFPQVPFHRLADLNHEIADYICNTSNGYGEFTRDYVKGFER